MAVYYRLNENVRMCGWDHLETGLVNRRNGQVTFVDPQMYQFLLRCNGTEAAESLVTTEAQRDIITQLVNKKIISVSEEPLPPLEEAQQYHRYHNRLIKSAHWSITGRCNYRCRHCYMSAPHGVLGELTYEQCCKIADDLGEAGVLSISLTGGEAMIHPRFWDIVDRLIENNIFISEIYSNGFLINEDFFTKCEERGMRPNLSVSFDGMNGAHAWLRGIPDAEEHFRRAVRLIQQHDFHYNVEMCFYRKSADSLRDTVRFLNDTGCTTLKINALSVVGEGLGIADQVIEREEQYRLFMDYIPQYKEDGITMPILACNVMLTSAGVDLVACRHVPAAKEETYCLCGHARNSMYISCTGRILPCIPYSENPDREKDFPSVLTTPLPEILTKSKYFDVITRTLADYLKAHPKCADCEYKYDCVGGCPGRAIIPAAVDDDPVDEEMCWHFKHHMNDRMKEISDAVFKQQ